ncbi:MAG: hypothetical protein HY901_07225 [Deltaproteobacteria bacterium]|nr:hypothetical protein [Deltaproteobacteria bacterium]
MKPILQDLLDKAFSRSPAREANDAIHRIRESEGIGVRSFELVAPSDAGIAWLEKDVLPRLVYHLESLGIRPPSYKGVFVSLFQGEELFFIRTLDFMAIAGAALHLSADQMYARWGTGELRRPMSLDEKVEAPTRKKEVLALPPGTSE